MRKERRIKVCVLLRQRGLREREKERIRRKRKTKREKKKKIHKGNKTKIADKLNRIKRERKKETKKN